MEYVNIELEHYNHKVGINFWHLTWQTKYRYKMFAKFEYKNLAEACIRKAAFRHSIKIHIIKVMPDHLHTLVTLPKGMTDEDAMHLLKGGYVIQLFQKPSQSSPQIPSRTSLEQRRFCCDSWLQPT